MELVGKLKEEVEQVSTREEAHKLIEDAGMRLSDAELDAVTGGKEDTNNPHKTCDKCMFGWSNCKVKGNEKCSQNHNVIPKTNLPACAKFQPRPF